MVFYNRERKIDDKPRFKGWVKSSIKVAKSETSALFGRLAANIHAGDIRLTEFFFSYGDCYFFSVVPTKEESNPGVVFFV
ncbi:MAG TPA: hypothetical protein VLC98_09400 [Phnomibacter sp.]|nr:hypothetical protein [Phnomibacter sp.]